MLTTHLNGSQEPEVNLISLEVAGPAAMFTRPDTGAAPVSYSAPTFSAAKGMFEAVARRPYLYIRPVCVEICEPIRFERYVTNYGGPLRSLKQLRNGNSYQLIATILADVCYRLHAKVLPKQSTRGAGDPRTRRRRGRHGVTDFVRLFNEGLEMGQTFYTPVLGWREFVPTYFGPLRSDTLRRADVNLVIPSMLYSVWEHGSAKPVFHRDVSVREGLMYFDPKDAPSAE